MYVRFHIIQGRRRQSYTYIELVFNGRPHGKVRRERACILGRLEELRESGALDRVIGKLAEASKHRWARLESPTTPAAEARGPDPSNAERGPLTTEHAARVDMLRASSIFSDLADSELVEISHIAKERRFKPGELIYGEDALSEYFYIVCEGIVKVLKHSFSGKDFLVGFLCPGDAFGGIGIFARTSHRCSVQAMRHTRILTLKKDDFLPLLARDPDLASRIFSRLASIMAARLMIEMDRLADMAVERVDQRLACTLLTLSRQFGATLPLTREELAQMCGTSTETAIRFINRLKQREIVHAGRGKITLLDMTELTRMLGDQTRVL